MKPTIGRIVIFNCNENQREKLNNYQHPAPAIITAVWSDDCVNLKVLLDGETNLWITSALKGTGENQWNWPVIAASDPAIVQENLDFGKALEALKQGKRVARKGWNGKGMFIFIRPADKLHVDVVVDKVKSLPQSVKDYYLKDLLNHDTGERLPSAGPDDVIEFTAYLCMKAADGSIVNGWLASQTDMLSEDWTILD